MPRFTKLIFSLLIISIPALLLKKMMFPFSSLLVVAIYDSLAVFYFASALNIRREEGSTVGFTATFSLNYFIFSLCSFSLGLRLQEVDGTYNWIRISFVLIAFFCCLFMGTLKSQLKKLNKVETKSLIKHVFFPTNYFLILISLCTFFNPRQYHNFFYGNTYEVFARKKFSDDEAERLIQQFKRTDDDAMEDAQSFFLEAKEKDSLKNYDDALILYNKCIDVNPDYAEAYYHRGFLKLTKLELEKEMVKSSYKDFSIAIKLKPDYAAAYYHRAVALSYFDNIQKKKIESDFRKSKELNNTFDISGFVKDTLPEKKKRIRH